MEQEIIIFQFENPTDELHQQIKMEFDELLEDIREGMKKAEHLTTTELQHSVFKEIGSNISKYITMKKMTDSVYQIAVSAALKRFAVKLPINGEKTKPERIASKIGRTFMDKVKRTAQYWNSEDWEV